MFTTNMERSPMLSSFISQSQMHADAVAFLEPLQKTTPNSFPHFRHLILKFINHKIGVQGFVTKMHDLLSGHKEDVFQELELTRSLPPQHQSSHQNTTNFVDGETISKVEKSVVFLNKLEACFGANHMLVLKLLLDRVHVLGKNHKYTGQEFSDLFHDFPDLFQEFKAFFAAEDEDDDDEFGCKSGFISSEFEEFLRMDERFEQLGMLDDIEFIFDLFEDRRVKLDVFESNLDSIIDSIERILKPIQSCDWDNLVPANNYFTALELIYIRRLYDGNEYLDAMAFLYENPVVGLSRMKRRMDKAKEVISCNKMKLKNDWREFLKSHFLAG